MTGKELKEKVVATRIPFTEIADKIGVTAQSLNSTFKSTDVRSNTIEKIAQAIGKEMSYFYPSTKTVQVTNNDNAHGNTATGNVTLEASNDVIAALIESNRLLAESTKSANEHLDKALEMLSQKQ